VILLDTTVLSNFAHIERLDLLCLALPDATTTPHVLAELGIGFPMTERPRDAKKQRAIDALDRLTHLRERIEHRSGVYQRDLIAEARAGRDGQMGRIWSGGEQ
jgi:hypothetical protein